MPHLSSMSRSTPQRRIVRGAFLCDFTGHYERILEDVTEVARKGYRSVIIFPRIGQEGVARDLCERAVAHGLSVGMCTNYIKDQQAYLADHPAQRLVLATEALDQDRLSTSNWGCPFHPQFKQRYLTQLRELAPLPAVRWIFVNDEALLLSGCYCPACRGDYDREVGGEMPCKLEPVAADWKDARWRRYLQWRLERWNRVHGEMTAAIHAANPGVKSIFQASPASDLWLNPWFTGVDLSSMVNELDGLCTDPYYTFHERHFDPPEVYLSEWCRFLRGLVPPGGEALIVPQGFSHATFSRPLGEADGYWTALVPPACGVNHIIPYTYQLQRTSPVQKAYENCFRCDPFFEKVAPLDFATVVHGTQTEIYTHPLPANLPASNYDATRVLPVTASLRSKGLPYAYLPDRALRDPTRYANCRALVLPEINCLSTEQRRGLSDHLEGGGNWVVLGELGCADETGAPLSRSFLQETLGIHVTGRTEGTRPFRFLRPCPLTEGMLPFDERGAATFCDGAHTPIQALNHCVDAKLPADAEVLAEFTDPNDRTTGQPAVAVLRRKGRVLWFAGFPSPTVMHPKFRTAVLNRARELVGLGALWAAGGPPTLRVENWPPEVPMRGQRPYDHRDRCTFEFFPLAGEDCFMGVVVSYFREPTAFPMVLTLPRGQRIERITELLNNRPVAFQEEGGQARIQVAVSPDMPALVYWLELARE